MREWIAAVAMLLAGCVAPIAGGLIGGLGNDCPASVAWEPWSPERYGDLVVKAHIPGLDQAGRVNGYSTAVCVVADDGRTLNPLCCEAGPETRRAFFEAR